MEKSKICKTCKYYVPIDYTFSKRTGEIGYRGYCELKLPNGAAYDVNQKRSAYLKGCRFYSEGEHAIYEQTRYKSI